MDKSFEGAGFPPPTYLGQAKGYGYARYVISHPL